MPEIGWRFEAITPAGVRREIHPTTTGTLAQSLSSEIRRTLSGLVFRPSEAEHFDFSGDTLAVTMLVDPDGSGPDAEEHPMGLFKAVDRTDACDVVVDSEGNPADMLHVDFGDRFALLVRSDPFPRTYYQGTDPTYIMRSLVDEAGLPAAITGPVASLGTAITFSPGTTWESIISGAADLAGHRRPWADNDGAIRSVAAQVVDSTIIDLSSLRPLAGTISIGYAYLSAPDRVIVADDQAETPTVGEWNAPASAPHSASRRGFSLVTVVGQQGLNGAVHATRVAETIGESLSARKLSATIDPTHRLDGPTVIRYRDALWLCEDWSVGTERGALMSVTANELVL